MLVIIAMPMMVACGSDDDNDAPSNSLDKHITSVEYYQEFHKETTIYNLHYDSNGNLLSINLITANNNHRTYPLEYLDNMIIMHPYYDDDIKYTLLNNRVVSIEDKYSGIYTSYSYDNDCLSSCSIRFEGNNKQGSYSYTWSNGNITKMKYSNGTEKNIEYTSFPWPTNYLLSFGNMGVFYDDFWLPGGFMAMGYCGKRPKNLPKKIGNREFEYTFENGYPVIIKVGGVEFKYSWN